MTRTILFLITILASCQASKPQNTGNRADEKAESYSMIFAVFSIHKDSVSSKNVIELLSKKEADGKVKKNSSIQFENYLTISLYSGDTVADSVTIEHPLYKRIEYLDENNKLSVMDTILEKAEFFIRLQQQGNSDRLKFFEKLKNRPATELNSIKL